MFGSGWGHKRVEWEFLAGETKLFEKLVNSVGEGQNLRRLERYFFPWAFLFEARLGLMLN